MEDHETESSRVKELTVNLQTAVDLIQTQARDLAAAEVRLARAHQALFEAGDEPVAQIGRLDEIKEILSTVEKPIAVVETTTHHRNDLPPNAADNSLWANFRVPGEWPGPVTVVVMAGGHE